MSKLSLDALKERAGAVASEELLNSISGGTANDCHPCSDCIDTILQTGGRHSPFGRWLLHVLTH
tara:strand:+ start:135 stop:326 length:192 start_codon:yes stop_codon:yes gene_type:complete